MEVDLDHLDIYLFDSDYDDGESDTESVADLHEPYLADEESFAAEKILAERRGGGGYVTRQIQYLIKWKNFPVIRSTWESREAVLDYHNYSALSRAYSEAKIQQEKGQIPFFDVDAFTRAVKELEDLEKGRRNIRRWKRQLQGVLQAIESTKVE